MMALVSTAVTLGYGLHLDDIMDLEDRERALMYTFVAPTISIFASTLGKISMVLFLVRLLGQSTRKFHLWLLYSVTAIMIGANIFTVGVLLGGCTPMEKAWKPEIPGSCVAPIVFNYVRRIQSGMFRDLLAFSNSCLLNIGQAGMLSWILLPLHFLCTWCGNST